MRPFSVRLKALRTKAGLSQGKLGELAGVHPVSICQYEKGLREPREEAEARILKALNDAIEKGPEPAPAASKKRGRPRKAENLVLKPRARKANPEPEPEADEGQVPKKNGGSLSASPVRLGQVSRSWVEQQADSFVHSRGLTLADGQVRVVTMRRVDLIDLLALALGACGTKVEGA